MVDRPSGKTEVAERLSGVLRLALTTENVGWSNRQGQGDANDSEPPCRFQGQSPW